MLRYDIAGISIEISSSYPNALHKFAPFSSLCQRNPDLSISLDGLENICKPEGIMLMNEGFAWMQRSCGNDDISVYMCGENEDEILYMLDVNNSWNNAAIKFIKGRSDSEYAITGALGEILFRNRILFHQGIVIHASAIEWEGKGIMFSAPSETGKSTQANLWKECMGANILNGDRPVVRVLDNQPYVYGTPWSGSSDVFANSYAPLSAIIMLEQSPVNTISRLSNYEAVSKLMPRAFLPYHNSKLMQLAITNLGKIITSTPVYLLKCRPDEEAVNLVYRYIK